MKKILLVLLVIAFTLCINFSSYANTPYTKYELYKSGYGRYIKTMYDNNILLNYNEEGFNADKIVTREEMMAYFYKIALNIDKFKFENGSVKKESPITITTGADDMDIYYSQIIANENDSILKEEGEIQLPSDMNDRWSKDIIRKFMKLGIIQIHPKQKFRPTDKITREEFAKLLYSFLNYYDLIDLNKKADVDSIKDISDSPYKEIIATLVANDILKLYQESNFKPKNTITRLDAIKFFVNYLGLQLSELPTIPIQYTVLNVAYVSQLDPVYAPIGCEATSVYAALRYKGYAKDISHQYFLDNMPRDYINPDRGFVGSYTGYVDKSKRESIFPKPLAKYAQKYGKAEDISGYSMQQIKEEIMLDNPVAIYVTLFWEDPVYSNYYVEGNTYRWISNNHVVVICGYNPQTNEYYVSDSLNKKNTSAELKYWVNGDRLEYLYNLRKHAIVIR